MPLRSPVSVCTFHAGSERNSSGSCMSSRKASILRSLSTVSGETPFALSSAVACSLTLVKYGPYRVVGQFDFHIRSISATPAIRITENWRFEGRQDPGG